VEQETGERDEVQPSQHGRKPLIVAGQPPEARFPGETALGYPAARQQDKAVLGFGQQGAPARTIQRTALKTARSA
jgi:hypothetical protein